MTIAALDYFHSTVYVKDISKEYLDSVYDGDIMDYFVSEHGCHPDNLAVISDVEHMDILLHFK